MSRVIGILAAGRAAVADSGNVGLNAVQIARVALGSGLKPAGADDDARAALRIQHDAAAATGAPAVAGDVAVRADIDPTATYSVTEVGIFARIGAGGVEFLFGYWAAEAAGDAIAAAVSGGATIVLATVMRVAGSAADVNVTPAIDLQIAAVADAGENQRGILKLATEALADAGADDETAMTPVLVKRVTDAATLAIRDGVGAAFDTLAELAAAVQNRLTETQADTRFGVRHLSVTRNADGSSNSASSETTLGSIDVTRTGLWLFQLTTGLTLTNLDIVGVTSFSIGGVVVVQLGLTGPPVAYDERFQFSRYALLDNGDTVTATGVIGVRHRYVETTFEAVYLGPAA